MDAVVSRLVAGSPIATYVDAFVGEAWRHRGALFFGVGQEDGKLVHRGHRDVSSIVSGEQGLP